VNNKEAIPPRLEVAAQPSCVSVIIPTRNRPRLLHSALDSVFRLSGPDLNLQAIVVDDAPSEETRLVAAEFGARHVVTIGRGAAAARNTGIREATVHLSPSLTATMFGFLVTFALSLRY
jgi:cellulose synthase/poly-beta-1,6-N-acetylglucosamine synthase-like glycosyltransferase